MLGEELEESVHDRTKREMVLPAVWSFQHISHQPQGRRTP
jgi:hypothetical protein